MAGEDEMEEKEGRRGSRMIERGKKNLQKGG